MGKILRLQSSRLDQISVEENNSRIACSSVHLMIPVKSDNLNFCTLAFNFIISMCVG